MTVDIEKMDYQHDEVTREYIQENNAHGFVDLKEEAKNNA